MEMSIRFPNMGIDFEYVAKSLRIFGFEITLYGILIAVGMLLGIAFVVLEAKRVNQNQDMYLDMMILSLLGAAVGARLYYVAFNWSLYKGNISQIFNARGGGLGFYGGLLGGVLAAAVFCRIKKLPFWQMADIASLGLLIGQMIGRWGNFFNRESFGEYTDGFFAMQLPLSAVRTSEVTSQMRENLETIGNVSYVSVHPTFLYESAWCLILFLLLLVLKRKKKFQGETFMTYLSLYGLGRFFIESLRTDQLLFPGTKIGVSLVVSAGLFIFFGVNVIVRRIMSGKREKLRRQRREAVYEAEERAYAEELAAEKAKEEAVKAESEKAEAAELAESQEVVFESTQEEAPASEDEGTTE